MAGIRYVRRGAALTGCLLAAGALLLFLADPWGRYLELHQLRLKFHGYERRLLESPEGRFYCYVSGEDRSGTPVIFLHGLGMSGEQWREVLIDLAGSRPLCAVEFLGFGRSLDPRVPPSAFSVALFARQVEFARERFGWERVIVAGVSLGGWVALHYVLDHPDRVAGLVLLAPGGVSPDVSGDRWERLVQDFNFHRPEGFGHLLNTYILYEPR